MRAARALLTAGAVVLLAWGLLDLRAERAEVPRSPLSRLFPLAAQFEAGLPAFYAPPGIGALHQRLRSRYGRSLPFLPPLVYLPAGSFRFMEGGTFTPLDRLFGREDAPRWEPFDLRGCGIPALYSPSLRRAFVFERSRKAAEAAFVLLYLDFDRLFPAGSPASFPTLDMLCRQAAVLAEAADFLGDERLAPGDFRPAGGSAWLGELVRRVAETLPGGAPPRFVSAELRRKVLSALGFGNAPPLDYFIVGPDSLAADGRRCKLALAEYYYREGGAEVVLRFPAGESAERAFPADRLVRKGIRPLPARDVSSLVFFVADTPE